MAKFKPGDVIAFKVDIRSSSWNVLLIPAKKPCKLIRMTKDHIEVNYNHTLYKLRNIEDRMIKMTGLAEALYE